LFKRGFFKGLVTGSILGMMTNMFMGPDRKPLGNRMRSKMRRMEDDGDDLMDEVTDGISGLWKK